MRQAHEHNLQANWHTADGKYHATGLIRCEPIPDWKHRGSVPGAVMSHARRHHANLRDEHPDALVLKVDVLESLMSWNDRGEARRMYVKRIGQHPSTDVELAESADWVNAWRAARNLPPLETP